MKKGTTPTHRFVLPINGEAIKSVEITYSQNKQVILQKNTYNCTIDGNVVSTTLSQLDTFEFADDVNVEIQLRVLDKSDNVFASNIMCVSCKRCLSSEVII